MGQLQYTEIGSVKSIRGCIIVVVGLKNTVNGQLVYIGSNGSVGTVVGFNEEQTDVLILKENVLYAIIIMRLE